MTDLQEVGEGGGEWREGEERGGEGKGGEGEGTLYHLKQLYCMLVTAQYLQDQSHQCVVW